jgi:hypothetical protein
LNNKIQIAASSGWGDLVQLVQAASRELHTTQQDLVTLHKNNLCEVFSPQSMHFLTTKYAFSIVWWTYTLQLAS